ncbi:SRPBCC family protein [Kineococcus glutinatus]|uniref:SRPBCC family protein n=1 Tax=Kineococcus glutinatus TaxID=1070872 RepID=A0ABP9HLT1_9ACTN
MTATTPLGRVVRDADGVHLEFVRSLDHPVADVWAALTDPGRLAAWFGTWTGDPTTGSVELTLAEEGAAPGRVDITACEPPRHLAVTTDGPEGAWPLEVTLRGSGAGTRLWFVHHLAEPFDASSLGPGWQYYLDRLAAALAGEPLPEDWAQYHPALAGAYAVPEP